MEEDPCVSQIVNLMMMCSEKMCVCVGGGVSLSFCSWSLPPTAMMAKANKRTRDKSTALTRQHKMFLTASIFLVMCVSSPHDVACHILLGGPGLKRKSSGLSGVAAQQFLHCSLSQTPTPPNSKKVKPSSKCSLKFSTWHGGRNKSRKVCLIL